MKRVRRTATLGAALAAAALAGGVLLGPISASSAPNVQHSNYPIATFTPATETTHNNMGNSVCAAGFQASQPVSENKGDLNAVKGSFLERVALPNGAKVRRLSLFANDNDGDDGTHLFLVRKLLQGGLSPQFQGYRVMAATQSNGAVLNTMRRFGDSTVVGATIDNDRFDYYLEAVNCATVEPFAAQIDFTP